MIRPKPPTGSGSRAAWYRWADAEIMRLRQIIVQGQAAGRTTRGTYILPPAPKPPSQS